MAEQPQESMACPQCGNPNLDVDSENSVVYCKNCGFAVRVDPQTGNVTPLSEGGAKQGAQPQAPPVYHDRMIFGMDPMTFFLLASIVNLGLAFARVFDITIAGIIELLIVYTYFRG